MNAVEIDHVTKSFGQQIAVNDLTLNVPEGSVYGFIGPNGSGKTTTLRMIMRIFHPDTGSIRVLGEEALESADDRVSYLPEERGLYKNMKVADVLRFYAALKGCNVGNDLVEQWLQRLGLGGCGVKKVTALSKGMAQRVQFIAAVISRPRLVLLDEPFTGLDPVNAELLREAVLDLRHEGTTVIFSTHDMAVAEKMCDFIFMIHKGNKVLDGPLESIQEAYGQDTVRVRVEGASLADLPGVVKVTDYGNLQELRLEAGAVPERLLTLLMERGKVRHFEIAHPSLADIFVRIAGVRAGEAVYA